MEDLQTLIDQMVLDICTQARGLDEVRFRLFADWLNAHSSQMKAGSYCQAVEAHISIGDEDSLRNGLRVWFQSLSVQGLLWEYHLVLSEVNWWCEVDELSLATILKAEKK